MDIYSQVRSAFAKKDILGIAADVEAKTESSDKFSNQCQAKLFLFPDFLADNTPTGICYASSEPGAISTAVCRPIDEDYYICSGAMELWISSNGAEKLFVGNPGSKLFLPIGAKVQFRVTSDEKCCYVVTTNPPYSSIDENEIVVVEGKWPVKR